MSQTSVPLSGNTQENVLKNPPNCNRYTQKQTKLVFQMDYFSFVILEV